MSPAVFRLESVTDLPEFTLETLVPIADVLEQEDGNSGFELNQETVGFTVFFKAERGKSENLLK